MLKPPGRFDSAGGASAGAGAAGVAPWAGGSSPAWAPGIATRRVPNSDKRPAAQTQARDCLKMRQRFIEQSGMVTGPWRGSSRALAVIRTRIGALAGFAKNQPGRFQGHGSDKEISIARWKLGWEILATGSPRRVTASANMQKKPQALPAAQRFLIVEILTASLCNAACCD